MKVTKLAGKFPAGEVVIDPEAQAILSEVDVFRALLRHVSCDWGELDGWTWKLNDDALAGGRGVVSQYTSQAGTTFWVITERDRSVTTILLAGDF